MPEPTRPTDQQGPDPSLFFSTTVPNQFREHIEAVQKQIDRLQKQLDDLKAVEVTAQVNLEGEGGGTWFVNVKDGAAAVAMGPASPPLLTLTQSIEDWRASVAGTMGPPFSLLGGGAAMAASASSQFSLSRAKVEKIKQMNGTVLWKIVGDEPGREWKLLMKFGTGPAAPQPNTTVQMTDADSKQILQGKLNPQAAFMAGKIKILGDMSIAMQIGMLMMAA